MSLAKRKVKHRVAGGGGWGNFQMGIDKACLYACLRKDPWRNKKFLANRNLLFSPPSHPIPRQLKSTLCYNGGTD